MNRIPVQSSNIKSIGYDREKKTLEIEFHKGNRVYQYHDVIPDIFQMVEKGTSVGWLFNKLIKEYYTAVEVGNGES